MEPKAELVQFETSTACNASCTICEHPNMKRKGTAKWSTLQNIMYWHAYKAKELCPFGMQEPTLEPRLPAVLASARQYNPKARLTIYSNLAKYDETVWRRILQFELLDTLAVSFYGVDEATYKKMQPPLDYATTKQNLKRLVKLKRELHVAKPEINLHILLIPETIQKAGGFAKEMRKLLGEDHVGFVHWDSWCGKKPYNDKFEAFVWGKAEDTRYPCPRLWHSMNIHYDGTVVPCCLDAHEMEPCGNVNDDPQAWYNNSRLNQIRQLHVEGRQNEIPLCKSCTVWKREHSKEWNEIWKQKTVLSAVNPCIKS